MAAALAVAERGRGHTAPNPNVGCLLVKDGIVVGRGWTQPGGRPHAEAVALEAAGEKSRGATCYVTLEPCAHESPRGPACSDLLIAAGVARAVIACGDPDPRTDGKGIERLRAAGIVVDAGISENDARRAMAGFLTRQALGRPFVTLKLATSLDGCIALASGESRWITGLEARAHAHLERARHEAILVGRGTFDTDKPQLDVRLPGLGGRDPHRFILTSRPPPRFSNAHEAENWATISSPSAIFDWFATNDLLVEGGAQTASAFLSADLVDRLLLYRAPILIGGGKAALGDIGLTDLAEAHGRWRRTDSRRLGSDTLEVYERVRQEG
jgi:diaminohydroxyphosphoribosylaminopyrimidine deaminase/5-amino-6-(5-phosphoribosylamino)uracil reductase